MKKYTKVVSGIAAFVVSVGTNDASISTGANY